MGYLMENTTSHLLNRDNLTLGGRLVARLREAILDGTLPPGRHLKDREMCEMFGVSRSLVREAVQKLAGEELIELAPHKGPAVAVLDRKTIADLYKVRAVLEGLASAEFAQNASDEARTALSQAVEQVSHLTEDDPADIMVARKNDFYECLLDGCGNKAVGQVFKHLNNRISRVRRLSLSRPGRLPSTIREIQAIHRAIMDCDADEARRLAEEHVRKAARIADEQFAELQDFINGAE